MNLLTDPVFRTQTPDGLDALSLPQLLEALGGDRVDSLLGLQRHQEDAFHIFLCYLAGAVLAREGQTEPSQTADFWLAGIRRLTGRDDDCAWTLVVEDLACPAFMQAPLVAEEDFEKSFSVMQSTPDALDVLPTSKNHDVKASRLLQASADDWVFALMSFQTMSGYTAKHQGIVRMNSGYGSRPCIGLLFGNRCGPRWQRETTRLLEIRDELLSGPWRYRTDGLVLTWTMPWDRKSSLSLVQLDPFFIEISRTARLRNQQGKIVARTSTETAPRIYAKNEKGEQSGVLGDPWIPINLNDKKKGESALTVSETGLTPQLLRNLLFKDGYSPAEMQQAAAEADSPDCRFIATVLVRGQGTTEGFHHISLPIPAGKARGLFRRGSNERNRLAELSNTALHDAKEMQDSVLKTAVCSLLDGGRNIDKIDRKKHEDWWKSSAKQFSETWAGDFFPWLWRQAEQEDQEDKDAARREWLEALRDKARAVLDDAIARYPAREGRRYRSRVKAEGLFKSRLHTIFPQLAPVSPSPHAQQGDTP